VLFVTEDKQESLTQYADHLDRTTLHWESEDGHQNDLRIAGADKNADEIHVFYRERHHESFRYLGQARVTKTALLANKPSQFEFQIL
jgi:hypothetical protein